MAVNKDDSVIIIEADECIHLNGTCYIGPGKICYDENNRITTLEMPRNGIDPYDGHRDVTEEKLKNIPLNNPIHLPSEQELLEMVAQFLNKKRR